MRPINVMSLCDGIACGAIALKNLGIPVNRYYGSEIKKAALKLTRSKWPDHIELGDVNSILIEHDAEGPGVRIGSANGTWYEPDGIDLFLCGSPCQSFSSAMPSNMRVGLADPKRSGLFLVCFEVFKAVKPRYYLWENVASMRQSDKDILSSMIGREPIFIDSSDFSAQMRKRLYWTNIPLGPRPPVCHDVLQDVLDDGIAVRVKKRKPDNGQGNLFDVKNDKRESGKPDPQRDMDEAESYKGKAPCLRASEDKGVTSKDPHYATNSFGSRGLHGSWSIAANPKKGESDGVSKES